MAGDAQGYVFRRLVSMGHQPHVAAGLVGNLVQESGPGLNVGAVGDGGNSVGMGQWNGPRKAALMSFASSRGADPYNLDTQIAFLDHELKTSESAAGKKIAATTTPQEAALVASREFWRPGDPWNENRVRYAETAYSQYGGGQPSGYASGVPAGTWGLEVPQLTAGNALARPSPDQVAQQQRMNALAAIQRFDFSTPEPYRMTGNALMRG